MGIFSLLQLRLALRLVAAINTLTKAIILVFHVIQCAKPVLDLVVPTVRAATPRLITFTMFQGVIVLVLVMQQVILSQELIVLPVIKPATPATESQRHSAHLVHQGPTSAPDTADSSALRLLTPTPQPINVTSATVAVRSVLAPPSTTVPAVLMAWFYTTLPVRFHVRLATPSTSGTSAINPLLHSF